MNTPCLPVAHHTAATLRRWALWRAANPSWHAPFLAAVACAGLSGAPLPAGPVRHGSWAEPGKFGSVAATAPWQAGSSAAALPWIGAPGWVRHGTNEYPSGRAMGPPFASIAPGGPLAGGGAALLLEQAAQTADQIKPSPPAVGGYPTLASLAAPDAPQPVPEPSALACVLVGIVAVLVGRRV